MDEFTEHQIYVISAECLSLPVFLTNLAVVVAACVIRSSTAEDLKTATILLGNVALADMVMPVSIMFGIFYPSELRSNYICAAELELYLDNERIVYSLSPMIIAANLAVLVSSKLLLCCQQRKPSTSVLEEGRVVSILLLGNLALADIGVAVVFPLLHIFPDLQQQSLGCSLEKGATAACSLTSMCCIVLIATDRYFFIVHSIRYNHYVNESRARLLIKLSWFLGILFGFVPVMVKAFYKTEQVGHCRFVTPDNLDVMLIAGGFAFPLIVATFVLYMAIYLKARKVSKSLWPAFQKTRVNRLKTKSVIVVFLSSSCFLITWGPYLISLMIYGSMCGRNVDSDRMQTCNTLEALMASPFPMLGFLNSLINPIIFAWWHRPFTKALNDIFFSKGKEKVERSKSIEISTIVSNVC